MDGARNAMIGFSRPKRQKPADPLKARFGLERRKLRPEVLRALNELMAENRDLAAKLSASEAVADRDPLTSALNRRAFMRALQTSMSFAERHMAPGALFFIDL